ncbi:MAG: ABC transporter substrate-binding protein [Gammaproteobacteria bacterium]|nr:MAG: ABC transporter substrate-binding protein [Gammaproteobacteria bacterium]
MTQLIIGRLAQNFNTQQRQITQNVIEKLLLSSLANNLSKYRGGKIDYMRLSGNLHRGRVSVRMRIVQQGQYPVALELRIAQGRDGWKVYDVAANGVSAVAHYRNYVRSVIQREGFEKALKRLAAE